MKIGPDPNWEYNRERVLSKLLMIFEEIKEQPNRVFTASDFIAASIVKEHLNCLVKLGLVEEVIAEYTWGRSNARKQVVGYRLKRSSNESPN